MLETIQQFKQDRKLALIGISRDNKKFGNIILKELSAKGYQIFPVHPELKDIDGIQCYSSLNELPDEVENLLLVVRPGVSEEIINGINPDRIKRVWMHRGMGKGSASQDAIEQCRRLGVEVVYGFCPMMFLHGGGFHRFHLWMRKNFGKIPAEFI